MSDCNHMLRDAQMASMPEIKSKGENHSLMNSAESQFDFTLRGLHKSASIDVYHDMLNQRWSVLIGLTFALYSLISLLFAGLYAIDPSGHGRATSSPHSAPHAWSATGSGR